jgi:hypothetical protein
MQKSIFSLVLAILPWIGFANGLTTIGFTQTAFAGQQTTTRTGARGNSQVTNRTYGNGQQNITRMGPRGNSQVTNRTYGNGQQTTTRKGPKGRTQSTNRSIGY